jgi:beta-glucanase (GH16 family)
MATLTATLGGVFGLVTFLFTTALSAGGSVSSTANTTPSSCFIVCWNSLFPPATPTTTTTTAPAFLAQTSSVPQSTTSDGRGDCGGVAVYKADGSPRKCTFDDEFDGSSLNTNLWSPIQTSTSGYASGQGCFEDSPNNVSVSSGTLNLTARQESSYFACNSPWGIMFFTQDTSGSVSTVNKFSQAYGLFEVKAKFPAATIAGLQSSLWLWPQNQTAYGSTWPASGEIDIAEWFSQYPNLAIPFLHYNPAGGTDASDTNDACDISKASGYNTYGVEWTPTSMSFIYDGQTCLTDAWNPAAPETKPQPFDLPFTIDLTQALGINTNQFIAGVTPLPATTSIDWVRVWS